MLTHFISFMMNRKKYFFNTSFYGFIDVHIIFTINHFINKKPKLSIEFSNKLTASDLVIL